MSSIWSKTTSISSRQALSKNVKTSVAVIGGGITGLLTAYYLQQKGIDTIILEASQICSGQTKNTTAKITSQHDFIYHNLIKQFGEAKAHQYANLNQLAIDEYKRIVEQLKIDCQFEECPSYLYSTESAEPLLLETEAALKLGIDASFTRNTTLPFTVSGAVKFKRQAQFHPLQFLQAIASELTIFENTAVRSVDGNQIITEHHIVEADSIVFTTHYPFLNSPGYYFLRMHQERSYVLALSKAAKLDGMYYSIDPNGLSLRNSGNLLLLGGGQHRTGENSNGGSYYFLRQQADKYWPDSQEKAHWSAQDCMTPDRIPYIGSYSASTPGWYVATGFNKWGMTSSMAAALLLSDAISGNKNPYADVFSPQRFLFHTIGTSLVEEGFQAVKGLTREFLKPSPDLLDHFPTGHGGIVEYDGHKCGVYKNDDGEIFLVSSRCPHLGCCLEWNADEKTWDCPCHGSRFDYKGNLLDNPAQRGISMEK